MHVAASVDTPTLPVVGNDAEAVGASPIRFWLRRTISRSSHSLCSENRFRNDECHAETHHCMRGVNAQRVIRKLEATLA
jgi:ADP-heptose:LPS heptosyltransferase